MGLDDGHYVLDVGSGIGGPARRIAAATGARVTGIDLTPAYTEAARTLTERVGLSDKARFETASALAMPFPDRQFDAAVAIHVAMNIADRPGLYREVARVLKPGARFGIYDVMTGAGGALAYPVPWAATPATSHLTTPDDMHALLSDAGFDVVETEDRSAAAIDFFKARDASAARHPQPPGLHVIMGETAREKFANIRAGVESDAVAPVVIIARKH